MSWHDPARSLEPETDSSLRNELRDLLGMPAQPANYFENEPSPELIRLADDLRREARRRNHTARRRSSWMLLAAAVPFALALGALGTWGLRQQDKASQLAAAVARQEAEIQQLAAAQQHPVPQGAAEGPSIRPKAPAAKVQPPQTLLAGAARTRHARPESEPMQLVIPVERSTEASPSETKSVKTH